MYTVKVSEFQKNEIIHKMTIVSEEQDLLDSYETDKASIDHFIERLNSSTDRICVSPDVLSIVINEMEDLLEMYRSNWKDCANDACGPSYQSIKSLLAKLKKLDK